MVEIQTSGRPLVSAQGTIARKNKGKTKWFFGRIFLFTISVILCSVALNWTALAKRQRSFDSVNYVADEPQPLTTANEAENEDVEITSLPLERQLSVTGTERKDSFDKGTENGLGQANDQELAKSDGFNNNVNRILEAGAASGPGMGHMGPRAPRRTRRDPGGSMGGGGGGDGGGGGAREKLNAMRGRWGRRPEDEEEGRRQRPRRPRGERGGGGGGGGGDDQRERGGVLRRGPRGPSLEELEAQGRLGSWVLVRIAAPPKRKQEPNPEDRFQFELCRLAHGLYSDAPDKLAFFKDLTAASHCGRGSNRKTMLWAEAKEYLEKSRVVSPTAFIHHEARCGSTLAINVLASNPRALAYSEPPPIVSASNSMCKDCDWDFRVRFLRLTVGLMGVSDTADHLFFKLLPITVMQVKLFQAAFPDTPNVWMHREPVEVMMSQLRKQRASNVNRYNQQIVEAKEKQHQANMERQANTENEGQSEIQNETDKRGRQHAAKQQMLKNRVAPCLRPLPEARQALDLQNEKDYASREDYCAVYLQKTCEAAVEGLKHDPHGLPVAYRKDLASYLIDFLIPEYFGVDLDPVAKQRAIAVSGGYSKASRGRGGDFKGDIKKKQDNAWKALKQSADKYVSQVYMDLVKMEEDKIALFKKTRSMAHH